ncbi:MAG TPA: 50S ribosomal protein L19 [Actinobacteria bacterium]|nr:50S ribosomal protein L19 [Actinomycetota bacterium]
MHSVDIMGEQQMRDDLPELHVGDTVRVHFKVVEAGRERVQVFQGIVLKKGGSGAKETFTARKISFGVGVEKTFPLHSPKIVKIDVKRKGKVRRSKLYYLREKIGKKAYVKEKRTERTN